MSLLFLRDRVLPAKYGPSFGNYVQRKRRAFEYHAASVFIVYTEWWCTLLLSAKRTVFDSWFCPVLSCVKHTHTQTQTRDRTLVKIKGWTAANLWHNNCWFHTALPLVTVVRLYMPKHCNLGRSEEWRAGELSPRSAANTFSRPTALCHTDLWPLTPSVWPPQPVCFNWSRGRSSRVRGTRPKFCKFWHFICKNQTISQPFYWKRFDYSKQWRVNVVQESLWENRDYWTCQPMPFPQANVIVAAEFCLNTRDLRKYWYTKISPSLKDQ